MIRKVQKTMVEFGRSSAANSFKPGNWPFQLWVRTRLPKCGICDSVTCRLGRHVGPAEQDQRHALARLVLPVTLDRGDFRRLMFESVEPV